jgi:hypothetical protein
MNTFFWPNIGPIGVRAGSYEVQFPPDLTTKIEKTSPKHTQKNGSFNQGDHELLKWEYKMGKHDMRIIFLKNAYPRNVPPLHIGISYTKGFIAMVYLLATNMGI